MIELVEGTSNDVTHIIIDEIQKLPKLLDIVHLLLESRRCQKYFILTGSSARKLKMTGVNLLAGRAFVSNLHPFSSLELGDNFSLAQALSYGMLPKVTSFSSEKYKQRFLQSYTLTYLKEEIWAEQLVKNLDPFRRFLEVAAQSNGKIINYSTIVRHLSIPPVPGTSYYGELFESFVITECLKLASY